MGKKTAMEKRIIPNRGLRYAPLIFVGMFAYLPSTSYSETSIIALNGLATATTSTSQGAKHKNGALSAVHDVVSTKTVSSTSGLSARIEAAMSAVSNLYHIPIGLLHAISLTESGINGSPWPWTLNVYGVPYRFQSANQTKAAVKSFLAKGIDVVDIGPMQVDWKYHHHQLENVTAAVNPLRNVAVAGRILKTDFNETGSWISAVGLYHGGGAQRQNTYINEVFSRWHHYKNTPANNQFETPVMHQGIVAVSNVIHTKQADNSKLTSVSEIVALVGPNDPTPQKG